MAGLVIEAIQTAIPLRRCSARLGRTFTASLDATECSAAQLGVAHCPCSGSVAGDRVPACRRRRPAVLRGRSVAGQRAAHRTDADARGAATFRGGRRDTRSPECIRGSAQAPPPRRSTSPCRPGTCRARRLVVDHRARQPRRRRASRPRRTRAADRRAGRDRSRRRRCPAGPSTRRCCWPGSAKPAPASSTCRQPATGASRSG